MDDEQMFWRGVPLEDLTKEELIVALKQMHSMFLSANDSLKFTAELARKVARRRALTSPI